MPFKELPFIGANQTTYETLKTSALRYIKMQLNDILIVVLPVREIKK